jgi:hypothetical protein
MRMKHAIKDDEVERIRTRASYLLFEQLYDFLNKKPSVPEILKKIHDILDAKKSFGSRRNADCAAESLDLVLKDNGVDQSHSEGFRKY